MNLQGSINSVLGALSGKKFLNIQEQMNKRGYMAQMQRDLSSGMNYDQYSDLEKSEFAANVAQSKLGQEDMAERVKGAAEQMDDMRGYEYATARRRLGPDATSAEVDDLVYQWSKQGVQEKMNNASKAAEGQGFVVQNRNSTVEQLKAMRDNGVIKSNKQFKHLMYEAKKQEEQKNG